MFGTRTPLAALAAALALAAPACVVRGSGTVGVTTTPVVVYEEPPPERVETAEARPGFVWIRGRWDRRGGQWVWIGGRWERERVGQQWTPGRWERRGNQWHWIDGTWGAGGDPGTVTTVEPGPPGPRDRDRDRGPVVRDHRDGSSRDPMYPTSAPPPPRAESYGAPRSGFVWISGRWDWRGGRWTWMEGRWERAQANMVWVPGRWEPQGNYYVWIDGRWDRAPAAPPPVVRDHRD